MDPNDPLVTRMATLNPYVVAGAMVAKRLVWDLHPQSWISRRRLRALRGTRAGEKAVILCNGPSLNKVDFDLLSGRCYTFGLNKINLLFDRTPFRPDSITAVNPHVIEQNAPFFNETDLPLFLDTVAATRRLVKPARRRVYLHSTTMKRFAKDCSMSVNQGQTVTYVAMQLAFHMGFSQVALVGCDHSFAVKGPANKTVRSGDVDQSHFDPSYFSGGVKWDLPDLFESEVAYGRAKQMYEAHDRRLYNCTEGGQLEIFERMDLRRFLDEA